MNHTRVASIGRGRACGRMVRRQAVFRADGPAAADLRRSRPFGRVRFANSATDFNGGEKCTPPGTYTAASGPQKVWHATLVALMQYERLNFTAGLFLSESPLAPVLVER